MRFGLTTNRTATRVAHAKKSRWQWVDNEIYAARNLHGNGFAVCHHLAANAKGSRWQ